MSRNTRSGGDALEATLVARVDVVVDEDMVSIGDLAPTPDRNAT
jgi:hypothetical protein